MPSFTVNATGLSADADGQAVRYAIAQANAQRANPLEGAPLAPLPVGSVRELLNSYEIVLSERLEATHASLIERAAKAASNEGKVEARWRASTDAQRAAALAALADL